VPASLQSLGGVRPVAPDRSPRHYAAKGRLKPGNDEFSGRFPRAMGGRVWLTCSWLRLELLGFVGGEAFRDSISSYDRRDF
jgi:hypothetical protein